MSIPLCSILNVYCSLQWANKTDTLKYFNTSSHLNSPLRHVVGCQQRGLRMTQQSQTYVSGSVLTIATLFSCQSLSDQSITCPRKMSEYRLFCQSLTFANHKISAFVPHHDTTIPKSLILLKRRYYTQRSKQHLP
jgi:hypothetical protein